jgi:Protein of unknown function (DUF1761)
VGSLWFSALFGATWTEELKRHNVILQKPSQSSLMGKMIATFIMNIIMSYAMALLVVMTNSTTLVSGLLLGLIVSIGFAAPTLASVFLWESRSLRLFFIDLGYPTLGIILSAMILSVW